MITQSSYYRVQPFREATEGCQLDGATVRKQQILLMSDFHEGKPKSKPELDYVGEGSPLSIERSLGVSPHPDYHRSLSVQGVASLNWETTMPSQEEVWHEYGKKGHFKVDESHP